MRLIGEEGEQLGVVAIASAIETAKGASLDLVEIAPQAAPPVCKIMDYGHYVFEQKKKKAASKKKQKRTQVKEVKIRPVTEEADFQVKLRNALRFLEGGDKVKVTLRFRGREMAHHELGLKQLKRFQQCVGENGTVEQEPKFEGRQVTMVIAPAKR